MLGAVAKNIQEVLGAYADRYARKNIASPLSTEKTIRNTTGRMVRFPVIKFR